ncbi:MAG: threonine synthase [Candidatus Hodarchaeales archaeon]|jgi:threonine synthase
MPYAIELECPKCKRHYPLGYWLKHKCGFRLRIIYDLEARNDQISRDNIKKAPVSHWKYRAFFPVEKTQNELTTGEGGTALVRAHRLGEKFGLKNLYLKLEHTNPSGSFKDRPISVGVSVAFENNATALSAASSGNAASSLASYGAKAGIKTVVFVPERASSSKVAQLVTLGATVVRVSGDEESEGDPSVRLFWAACEKWGWTPCPSFGPFNPFQFEGTKSLGFEIVEQLEWDVPDWILCNTGSGGLLGGTAVGFRDWLDLGWIEKMPRFVVVQPTACDPVVKAFKDKVKPLEFSDKPGFPDTVAGGLADPHPWDADTALEMLYLSKGEAIAVSDSAILEAQQLLASTEGLFGSPSGVAAIAALKNLVDQGLVDRPDVVVVPITGHGLKDPKILQKKVEAAITCPADLSILARELEI